jgi:sugar O-acyltransferase (sialic acid O-acetyltransferase NeuD family)
LSVKLNSAMVARDVIIFGAGGHALVVADAVRACGGTVVGHVDTVSPERKGQLLNGVPIIGDLDELLAEVAGSGAGVAFGFGDCAARYALMRQLSEYNIELLTIIHPAAIVSRFAEIGRGGYVGPQAVVEAQVRIGEGAIINCGACICHECRVGNAVTVCPGVMIGGKTRIGDRTWLGIGATLLDKVSVGAECVVGAGAVVVSDLPDRVLAVGVPARIIRKLD